ncbi:putative mfs [Phaeomoniella chlamydospora]|uniref:Putative mfs n=1 Tax=Phaeomoniella chlamydospora TaxID=158046 RepID=A0A0G2G7U4_PHACM|nr:putative mfs [Phaeomoniella chlamydospora]
MQDEKIPESHGGPDPSANKNTMDSITNAQGNPIQKSNANDIANYGVDETRNKDEIQTPPALVHSVFSPKMKIFLVLMTVFSTIFSPFSSFIYLPAITPIAKSYHRSLGEINLTVTVYQIMQAIAPLFFGDLSDQIGRRLVYIITFAIYIAANIGLALQHNYAALMVLRALQSTGSSATVAIGSAVMSDVTTSAERGGYITAVQASVMFAPALAPVLGGILTKFLGWRSTFWFLVIAAGVFLVVYVSFVPETARNIVGNGSIPPPRLSSSLTSILHWRRKLHNLESQPDHSTPPQPKKVPRKIPIPNIAAAILIIFEKDVGLLMFFMSLFVMANYAMLVPLQDVIRRQYNFNDLQVGLCYIPFSIGSIVGSVGVGKLLNWNYARVARSIGVSVDLDLYPMNPGRVSSSFNLTRASTSAVGTAVVQYIIDAWGYGFTYLFMGLVVLAASPSVWIVRNWGPKWREERYQRFERARASES